jgi:hypothetical protein
LEAMMDDNVTWKDVYVAFAAGAALVGLLVLLVYA